MTQNYINNNKIKEDKYKILRMSLILGSDNLDDRSETINNFEESAREIDAMNDEIYLKGLEDKFYDTLKLEEEEQKLAKLVDYIGGRVEQRISLLSDFANITGYDLSNLPSIKYYDKLDDYKERLKYIREYLSNTKQITNLTKEIEESEIKLNEAYVNKATSEECNARNEEILLTKFNNIIKTVNEFKNINETNLEDKLEEIILKVEDSKKSLDIFIKSYTTLKGTGISHEEEQEYKSYVDNAKEAFYANKEIEYLLEIYKLLLKKETEYNQITLKRETINNLLYERLGLIRDLEIPKNDILNPLYDLLERQYNDIERQKANIETIEYLTNLIATKKQEKIDLDTDNQKVEILSILREFCIIDTFSEVEEPITNNNEEQEIIIKDDIINDYKVDEPKLDMNQPTVEETPIISTDNLFIPKEESKSIEEEVKDNQVIDVKNASNLDINLIQSKAGKVMKRVGEMLGIKTEETKIVNITAEETPKVELKQEPVIPSNPLPEENPLFQNNIEMPTIPPADPEDDNNFWFPSDMPDALNELPDLEISNENPFMNNNNMLDLSFPEINLDFGPNNTEDKL